MTCGIYKIINKINQKYYLGSSKNIEKRWDRHISDLKNQRHHSILLQRSWNKYGEENFDFTIIEVIDENQILIREQELLEQETPYNPKIGFNIGTQATGGDNLTHNPNKQQIIENISKAVKKRYENETSEQKLIRCENIKGSKNPNYGNRWNDTQRSKMSKRRQGSKASQQTRDKIGKNSKEQWQKPGFKQKRIENSMGSKNPFFGKKHTQETKNKSSEKALDRFSKMNASDRAKYGAQQISIDGQIFDSLSLAAKHFEVCRETIAHRLRSKNPKYENYILIKQQQEC